MTVRPGRALALLALALPLALGPVGAKDVAPLHDPPWSVALDGREPGRVALVWKPAEENRGVEVLGYEVWRRPAGVELATGGAAWVQLGAVGPDVTWYLDGGVTSGTRLEYRVVSVARKADKTPLEPGQARRPSEVLGPIDVLFDTYVSLIAVQDGAASLCVHRWLGGQWERSAVQVARPGDAVGAKEALLDFSTGAALVALGTRAGEGQDPVGWVTLRLPSGAEVELTTLVDPPALVGEVPGRRRERREVAGTRRREKPTAEAPAPPPEATAGVTGRSMRFPEPSRVGTVKGKTVFWEIENSTPFRITVYVAGPTSTMTQIEAGETSVVRLARGGDYEVRGRVATSDRVAPAAGEFSLASGTRYRSRFAVEAVRD